MLLPKSKVLEMRAIKDEMAHVAHSYHSSGVSGDINAASAHVSCQLQTVRPSNHTKVIVSLPAGFRALATGDFLWSSDHLDINILWYPRSAVQLPAGICLLMADHQFDSSC